MAKAAKKAKTKVKKKSSAKTKGKALTKTKSKIKAKSKPKAASKSKPKDGAAGAIAPDFRLRDGNGKIHRLANYKGQKVVLYFYPQNDTPGCTLEAKEFKKENKRIVAKGAVLLGVSPDNEVSHKRFSEKLDLNFSLLADPDCLVASKYGAYGEKTLYGTKFMSVFRSTFIIDEEGTIKKVFKNVQVEGHAKEVLKAL